MTRHLPITLERLASLRARIDAGASQSDILLNEGLSSEAWLAAQRGWLEAMGKEAAAGRHLITTRYQQAYLRERPELLSVASDPEPEVSIDATTHGLNLDLGAARAAVRRRSGASAARCAPAASASAERHR